MGYPGFSLLPVTGFGTTEPSPLPLCNYKTARNKATEITQNDVLIISNIFGIAYLT